MEWKDFASLTTNLIAFSTKFIRFWWFDWIQSNKRQKMSAFVANFQYVRTKHEVKVYFSIEYNSGNDAHLFFLSILIQYIWYVKNLEKQTTMVGVLMLNSHPHTHTHTRTRKSRKYFKMRCFTFHLDYFERPWSMIDHPNWFTTFLLSYLVFFKWHSHNVIQIFHFYSHHSQSHKILL